MYGSDVHNALDRDSFVFSFHPRKTISFEKKKKKKQGTKQYATAVLSVNGERSSVVLLSLFLAYTLYDTWYPAPKECILPWSCRTSKHQKQKRKTSSFFFRALRAETCIILPMFTVTVYLVLSIE